MFVFITVTNNTNTTFPEVAVRDWLPDDVTFVSAASQGECFYSQFVNNVFCELGNIPARGSVGATIIGIPTRLETFTNTAWDILNNRADANFTVSTSTAQSDTLPLTTLTSQASAESVTIGEPVTFHLTETNHKPYAVGPVLTSLIFYFFSALFEFASASSS